MINIRLKRRLNRFDLPSVAAPNQYKSFLITAN